MFLSRCSHFSEILPVGVVPLRRDYLAKEAHREVEPQQEFSSSFVFSNVNVE